MRKVLLLLSLLVLSGLAHAHEKGEKTNSRIEELASREGVFLKKEFYDLPSIGTDLAGIESCVVILTDLSTGKKTGCVTLDVYGEVRGLKAPPLSNFAPDAFTALALALHHYEDDNNYRCSVTVDRDKLGDCIKCLEIMQTEILTGKPEEYTETAYVIDGITFGAFYSDDKWTAYVRTKDAARIITAVEADGVAKLTETLRQAEAIIKDKTHGKKRKRS